MKKHMIFCSFILGTIFLSSCGTANPSSDQDSISTTEDTEQSGLFSDNSLFEQSEEAPSYAVTNVEEQLTLIAENSSLWLGDTDGVTYQYAITDFDQNGRLEIITTFCEGTGLYSYNQIYEVNEGLDTLTPCTTNWEEGDSQPDMAVSSVPVYYDFEHNVYLYVFDDTLRISATEYYENKQTFSLQNKQIVSSILATRTTQYTENSEEPSITCTQEITADCFTSVPEDNSSFWDDISEDSDDKTTNDSTSSDNASSSALSSTAITNEEYDTVADTILCAYEKKTAKIEWMSYDYSETLNMDIETIYHFLKQSYEGFLIQ